MAQRSSAAEAACYATGGHSDARECLEKRAAESARSLERIEAMFREAIGRWDEEAVYRTRTLAVLEESSKAFRRYRSDECELQATLAAGGNAAGDRRLLCEVELNNERTAQLAKTIATVK